MKKKPISPASLTLVFMILTYVPLIVSLIFGWQAVTTFFVILLVTMVCFSISMLFSSERKEFLSIISFFNRNSEVVKLIYYDGIQFRYTIAKQNGSIKEAYWSYAYNIGFLHLLDDGTCISPNGGITFIVRWEPTVKSKRAEFILKNG